MRVALPPEYGDAGGRFIDEDTLCPPGMHLPDSESIERLWALVEMAAA